MRVRTGFVFALCLSSAAFAADGPAVAPPAPAAVRQITTSYTWAKIPTPTELEARYPRAALNDGIEGFIVARCTVREDLSLSCTDVVSTPEGTFEEAGTDVIALFRVAPLLREGKSAVGATFPLRVRFQIAE